uniref:Uncharacterized protein n=1 Tax=Oryzias latipes TaxID=8090 RepID=A0A3P9M6L3_ORYLA
MEGPLLGDRSRWARSCAVTVARLLVALTFLAMEKPGEGGINLVHRSWDLYEKTTHLNIATHDHSYSTNLWWLLMNRTAHDSNITSCYVCTFMPYASHNTGLLPGNITRRQQDCLTFNSWRKRNYFERFWVSPNNPRGSGGPMRDLLPLPQDPIKLPEVISLFDLTTHCGLFLIKRTFDITNQTKGRQNLAGCSTIVPGDRGSRVLADWYFLCGHTAYASLPPNWGGLCALVPLVPPVFFMNRTVRTPHPARRKRSNRYALLRLLNTTYKFSNASAAEMSAIRTMVLQNRLVLDLLTASSGGVCRMVGDTCCTFIPDGTSDGQDISTALHDLTELQAHVKSATPGASPTSDIWSWLTSGPWWHLLLKLLTYILIVLCLFFLFTTCALPCVMSMIAKATIAKASGEMMLFCFQNNIMFL